MFYNRALTFNFKERRGGFSLAEVVITLLIISIILILAAPHITKRLVPQKTEGIVFTYNGSNTNVNDKCFVYQNSSSGYISTNECSEYRFTVPDGVEKVNLTLVAGGGGGGGAGGGIINEKTQIVEMSSGSSKEFTEYFGESLQSFIRNIKIKFLAAKGLDGQKISSADDLFEYDKTNGEVKIKQAKGGNSSPAVVDFIIPQELYRTPYDNAFSAYTKSNNRITASSKLNPDDTKTSVFTLTPRSGNGNNIVITADSTNGEVYCTANGGNCKIPDKNIIMPVLSKATSAYSLDLSSLPYQSDKSFGTIAGGNGGKLPVYSTYGKGGNGTNINCSNSTSSVSYSLKDFLSSKKINTAQSDMYSWLGQNDIKCSVVSTYTSGSEGAIIYSYEVETPGGVGGGGSGGGAIRIVDFQVASGETYVIRVGKGGAGGGSGQYGYRTYKTNDSSKVIRRKAAQSGGEGGNGVSTSIWKVNGNNETLVYYITGGKGGGGGHVQNITSDTSTSAPGGTAGSVIPVIGSGTNENLDVKNFDTTISKPQAGKTCSNAGLSGNKRCSSSTKFYTEGNNIVQPYAYLNNKLSIANNYNDKNGGITLNGLSFTLQTLRTASYKDHSIFLFVSEAGRGFRFLRFAHDP